MGLRVARVLQQRLNNQYVTVIETSIAGVDFLDLLTGYDKAILIDAVQGNGGEVGQVYRLEVGNFAITRHASTPHDINFATALELGKRLGLPLPAEIIIFAVEVQDVETLSEECTPEVARAITPCVDMVIKELERMGAG